jgi:hypothetical protein
MPCDQAGSARKTEKTAKASGRTKKAIPGGPYGAVIYEDKGIEKKEVGATFFVSCTAEVLGPSFPIERV